MRRRLSHFDIRAIISERTEKTLKRAQGRHPKKKKAEKMGRDEDSEKVLKMALEKVHETLQIKINFTL